MAISKDALKKLLDLMQKLSLAIAAVSVALLSNTLLSHDSVEKRAQADLEQLLNICKEKGATTIDQILSEARNAALRKMGKKPGEERRIKLIVDSIGRVPPASLTVELSYPADCKLPRYSSSELPYSATLNDFDTLERMREVWNWFTSQTMFWQTGTKISDVKIVPYLENEKEQFPEGKITWRLAEVGEMEKGLAEKLPINDVWRPEPGDASTHLRGKAPLSDAWLTFYGLKPEGISTPWGRLLIGAILQIDSLVDVKAYKFSPGSEVDPIRGARANFADAFPNLDKLTIKYQSEKLRSLSTLLQETVSEQQKGDIEVFGAKIPSELIALLGLPILAILLFQFSAVGLYLQSNIEEIDEEEAADWSFMLRGLPFSIMNLVTSFLLPAGVSAWTLVFVWGGDWRSNATYTVLTITVLTCSAVSGFAMFQLRSRVAKTSRPARLVESV